jgi:hypothetical protein
MASSLLAGAVGSLLDHEQQLAGPTTLLVVRGDDAVEGVNVWLDGPSGPTRMELIASDTFELEIAGELIVDGVTVEALDGRLTLHVPSAHTGQAGVGWYRVTRIRSGLSLTVAHGPLVVEAS